MRSLSIALLLIASIALWGGFAQAQVEAESRARAAESYQRAKQADSNLRFADAVRGYQDALTTDPSAPFAPAAGSRARWLQQRSEGAFAPLARVEAMRRDHARLADPDAVRRLDQDASGFPPGLVRAEAWLIVADASVRFLHNSAQASDAWKRVLQDPSAGTPERVVALGGLVDQSIAAGDTGAAAQTVRAWGDVAPSLRAKVLRLHRRSMFKTAALAMVAAAVLAAIAAWVRIARRGGRAALRKAFSWYAVAVGGYLGAGGAALCYSYDRELTGVPAFAVLGAGVTLMMCAARAYGHAASTRSARVGAVALGVVGVLAVALLAMLTSPPLLEGFGL